MLKSSPTFHSKVIFAVKRFTKHGEKVPLQRVNVKKLIIGLLYGPYYTDISRTH